MKPSFALTWAACLLLASTAHAQTQTQTQTQNQTQDICAPITRLLTNAPQAFIAARTGPDGDQRWTTHPIVPSAACSLWQSRAGDSDTLRCNINDHAAAAKVDAFYKTNLDIIDRCLAAQPALGPWGRTTQPIATEGLKGTETIWVHDTDQLRFSISLASYLRTVTKTSYDSFTLEYLRY